MNQKNWNKIKEVLNEENLIVGDLEKECYNAQQEFSGITISETEKVRLRWLICPE